MEHDTTGAMSPRPLAFTADLCSECFAAHGRFLPTSSAVAMVDYFRCGYCGHVWTLPKGQRYVAPVAATSADAAAP